MSENTEFKAGQEMGMLIAEVRSLTLSVDKLKESFEHMNRDLWRKIDEHAGLIVELKTNMGNLKDEYAKLDAAKTWIIRTVGGLIIAGLIGLIYKVR